MQTVEENESTQIISSSLIFIVLSFSNVSEYGRILEFDENC